MPPEVGPIFANINILDKDDHFKDIYWNWKDFGKFLNLCSEERIRNLYIKGKTADVLLYKHLDELLTILQQHEMGFDVGIRTNGYSFGLYPELVAVANLCKNNVGISVPTLESQTNMDIMGREHIPNWDMLLPQFTNLRITIVVNRYNVKEIPDMIEYFSLFENINYIELRSKPVVEVQDLNAFSKLYKQLHSVFQPTAIIFGARIFNIFDKTVILWPTRDMIVNRYNYFSDGTYSQQYCEIDGYMKAINYATR